MRYTLSVFFIITTLAVSAQTTLLMEAKSYSNSDETWVGVNIPRSTPTILTFKNNSISSVNLYGYMLQAGDEVAAANNNNLDGAKITGNKFTWTGTDMTSITHGLFTGHNINVLIKYNYLDHVPMGIIRKSTTNMTNTSGGVAYNIIRGTNVGIVVKGMSGVSIFNNTLYQDRTTSETSRGLIDVYTNSDVSPKSVSHGTKIQNNIFYTRYETTCINIMDQESLSGLVSDYNVFYCETGSPKFRVAGSVKTFAEWQAMGYDLHSVVINPEFTDFVYFVPKKRLDYGTNLGSAWAEGLSVNARWGTSDPETALQNGPWQVGAIVYKEVTAEPAPIPVYLSSVINEATPSRLEMTYNLPLASIIPATSAFTVKVNSALVSVSSVIISGAQVILSLSSPVVFGDIITVAYTKPALNPLQTSSGGQAASMVSQGVVNNRVAPANKPPVITISSPVKSTAFIAPAIIAIDATASDPDGVVIRVEFYSGTVKLGESIKAPWSFIWKEVPEGTYSITAAATDNSNARTVSSPVTVGVEKSAISVNQLPQVAITSPLSAATYDAPAKIVFTVSANDPDGSVTRVEYFGNHQKLGESTMPPFSFSAAFDTAGIYEFTAIAYDNLNATAMSPSVTISIGPGRHSPDPDLINVYPNPNKGQFTVALRNIPESIEEATLTILSLSGNTVYSNNIIASESSQNIDISESLPGHYVIALSSKSAILSARRFIIF